MTSASPEFGHPWLPSRSYDEEIGALIHGPRLVTRSPGIAAAVRCVFAHADALEIELVLRATGVQAEAAGRQYFGRHLARASSPTLPRSEPSIWLEVGGQVQEISGYGQCEAAGGDDDFRMVQRLLVAVRPPNGAVTISAEWPAAGLAKGGVTLRFDLPEDLKAAIVRLD